MNIFGPLLSLFHTLFRLRLRARSSFADRNCAHVHAFVMRNPALGELLSTLVRTILSLPHYRVFLLLRSLSPGLCFFLPQLTRGWIFVIRFSRGCSPLTVFRSYLPDFFLYPLMNRGRPGQSPSIGKVYLVALLPHYRFNRARIVSAYPLCSLTPCTPFRVDFCAPGGCFSL